jgi:peptidoglycan/xylan/chitin deacetylase (PgdA/CDA1 family)
MAVSVLMYHQVGPFAPPPKLSSNFCHVAQFARQMRWLSRLPFQVVPLRALVPIDGNQRTVVLTFDDGYRNFYEHALPILMAHGLTATVFVCPDLLGKRAEWLTAHGLPAAPLMDARQVREAHVLGMEVGAHSCSHVPLHELPYQQLRYEVADCKAKLEDLLSAPVVSFCYPFGKFNKQVMEMVAEAGYRWAVTTRKRKIRRFVHPFAIPRLTIGYRHPLVAFFVKLPWL